jgi:hypothetical protein
MEDTPLSLEKDPNNPVENRRIDGTFGPGNNANPAGRPKGKTLKEFAREYFLLKTEEEKKAYIEKLEDKRPGFIWEMAEGRAKQDMDIKGEVSAKIVLIDE